MDMQLLSKGMVRGMEMMGASFVKRDGEFLYFDVPKGCEADSQSVLHRAKEIFKLTHGLGLKVRFTEVKAKS